MGDLQVWPQPNGILTEESAPSANPHPSAIDANRWAKAELRTSEIILCIQPTVQSEQKRNEVIEYVQRLLRMRGLEVRDPGILRNAVKRAIISRSDI